MDQDKWTDHTRVWAAVFQARGGVLANSCTPAKRWMWVQNLALRHSDAPVAREIPPAPWWFDLKGFFQHRTGVADRKEERDWAVEYMQKYELCLTVGEQEEAFLEDCSASGVYDLTDLLQLRAVRKHLSEHGVQPPAWVDATIRNLRQRLTLNYHNHTGKGGKKSDAHPPPHVAVRGRGGAADAGCVPEGREGDRVAHDLVGPHEVWLHG
eukprot:jgi/Mesvir1/26070/Mv06795-RA.1